METPSPELIQRVERIVGKHAIRFLYASRGYTPAERWSITFSEQTSAFVKMGTTAPTSARLRGEHQIYTSVKGAFMPRYFGWEDDGVNPLLILEDLSQGFWPPPWNTARIDAVIHALSEMHASSASAPPYHTVHGDRFGCWHEVAANPKPFLSLGLASEKWLERALPILIEQEDQVELSGTSLIHFDIRSDNICLRDNRAVLVDWDCACLGNPKLDLGSWLPSLQAEGGPQPESILPNAGSIAAWVSGFFASRAGLPQIPQAPRVREVQRVQLETALPWAIRALELPPLSKE
ncbi:phosphotransferase [Candidatus Poribacteria bacterium]|nr:phosphotransferase [Candidatus Poribacteria bacterium]